jgi:hypothetical protein
MCKSGSVKGLFVGAIPSVDDSRVMPLECEQTIPSLSYHAAIRVVCSYGYDQKMAKINDSMIWLFLSQFCM